MTITAQDMVHREVYYCVSTLIGDLCQLTCNGTGSSVSVDYEDLLAICSQDRYEDVVDDYIGRVMTPSEVITALEDRGVEPEDGGQWLDNLKDAQLALLNDIKENGEYLEWAEEYRLEPDRLEAYEHYIVSDWLASKLEAEGEMVSYNICGLTVWGRCTTGQAVSMDYVVQKIHKDLTAED